jgi:hypothetical protein
MAKYTPTLLGKDTEINIAPFFGGGFVDAGAAQLNQAVQNNARAITEAKNKKFEQAQKLRDGIVSGHFSDIMAAQVGEDIAELASMGTYSEAYQVKLAEANARLGVNVAKQEQITTGAKEITDQFQQDPSNKYYERNALGANLDDTIQSGGLNTTRNDLDDSFKYFKNNTKNIKDGVVRTDFQSKLGEIVQKVEATGGLTNVNSEFAKFTKTSDGQKFVTGYTYDPVNRMYIPAFDESKLPPRGLVELYRGIDDAAATLMDDYVSKKHKEKADDPNSPITEFAKDQYERRFILEEMQKLAPGGSMQDIEQDEFRSRRAPTESVKKDQIEKIKDKAALDAVLNKVEQVRLLDANQMQSKGMMVNYVDIDPSGTGNPIRMLDLSGTQDLDIPIAKQVYINNQTGERKESYVAPNKVYLDVDEESGMNSLYLVTGDDGDETYTVYNDRNISTLALRLSNANFGGSSVYKNWNLISQQNGELSRDGITTNQLNKLDKPDSVIADGIRTKNDAISQGAEAPSFDVTELNNNFKEAGNNHDKIDAALEPVNIYFAREGHFDVGIVDRNGKQVTDKRVKYLDFKRDGYYGGTRGFDKKYGILRYKVDNGDGTFGPEQTVEMKTSDFVNSVAGSAGQFNLNQER